MNMTQMMNMVMRLVMRKLLNKGVNAGINALARRGGAARTQAGSPPVPGAKNAACAAKMAARSSRQAGRF